MENFFSLHEAVMNESYNEWEMNNRLDRFLCSGAHKQNGLVGILVKHGVEGIALYGFLPIASGLHYRS